MLAVLLAVVLWSTSFVFSAEALKTASPAVLSVGRFVIGLAILIPLAARRAGFRAVLMQPRTFLLGLLGVALYYALTNVGLEFTTAGSAALSNAALPALTALGGFFALRERPGRRTLVGLGLASLGVVVVAGARFELDVGIVICLVGLACYAAYTVMLRMPASGAIAPTRIDRPDLSSPDAIVLGTASAVWGTAIMIVWLAVEFLTGNSSIPSTVSGVVALLVLGLAITAPTLVLFIYGAERLPAATTGVLTAAIPALGYLFALALGESPVLLTTVGGALSLLGVVVAATSPTPKTPLSSKHTPRGATQSASGE